MKRSEVDGSDGMNGKREEANEGLSSKGGPGGIVDGTEQDVSYKIKDTSSNRTRSTGKEWYSRMLLSLASIGTACSSRLDG